MIINDTQIEQIRLLMSTYQDGSGQLRIKDDTTLPNWRDFERSVATAFKGYAFEDKGFIDVVIDGEEINDSGKIGISCKMRKTLKGFQTNGIINLELTNASNKLWAELNKNKIESIRFVRLVPDKAGKIIVDLYESWKYEAARNIGLNIEKSFYLVCLYNDREKLYQLFALPFLLPNPANLKWSIREPKDGDQNKGTLIGKIEERLVIEWYGTSGGQLKYYPTKEDVLWKSDAFNLEPIPNSDIGYGLIQKAKTYFPNKWIF